MPDSSVGEIMDAMAAQIQAALCGTADPLIEQLTVYTRMQPDATVPGIDIFPADPFTLQIGYGDGNRELMFTVRARVSTADTEGGQDLLLSMMDSRENTSLSGAIQADVTLGGVVEDLVVDGPSGFTVEPATNADGSYIGSRWTVRVTP